MPTSWGHVPCSPCVVKFGGQAQANRTDGRRAVVLLVGWESFVFVVESKQCVILGPVWPAQVTMAFPSSACACGAGARGLRLGPRHVEKAHLSYIIALFSLHFAVSLQMMGKWRVSAPKLVGLHRQVSLSLGLSLATTTSLIHARWRSNGSVEMKKTREKHESWSLH